MPSKLRKRISGNYAQYVTHRQSFQTIFGCALDEVWKDHFYGFDLLAFDQLVLKGQGKSIAEETELRFGEEGVSLLRQLAPGDKRLRERREGQPQRRRPRRKRAVR